MSNRLLRRMAIVGAGIGLWMAGATSAPADFIIDPNPDGLALNLAGTGDNFVVSGTGKVGAETINIASSQSAKFASGDASITPENETISTTITFTPEHSDVFTAANFRGQLKYDGDVTITVHDNLDQTFTFTEKKSQNFASIGVVALTGTHEFIEWVSITGVFKDQKQTQFGYYTAVVPEPATMIAGALLLLPFGVSTMRVLRRKA